MSVAKKLPPWPGYSAMHNNVAHWSAAGDWRCTKCGKLTMFGAHGLCPGRVAIANERS